MGSGEAENVVVTSEQYLNATQRIFLKQQFDVNEELEDFRFLLKAKTSGEYSTPDHMVGNKKNPSPQKEAEYEDMLRQLMGTPDEPDENDKSQNSLNSFLNSKMPEYAQKSIQKSFKDLMEKGSPVPDWARPKNANRNDVIHSDGQNVTNEFKDFGGDVSNYGGGYNQRQVQREESDGVGYDNVKDFSLGSYGDTDAFQQDFIQVIH